MYNEKIENLINLALVDGEITSKEREVLLKKAETEGIDLDEFEMVLDARLFEKQKSDKQSSQNATGQKSDKFGNLKKCPACSALVQSYSTICEECDFEFTGIKANNTIEKIAEKLENVRLTVQEKSTKNFLTQNIEKELREKEIKNLQRGIIENLPIPNTREDILELLHFISPKLKKGFYSDEVSSAWRIKFSEIIEKGKYAYSNDKKMLSKITEYEEKYKIGKSISVISNLTKEHKTYLLLGLFFLAMMVFGIVMHKSDLEKQEKEKERLEQILNQINIAIEEKNYDRALTLSSQIKWEGDDGNDSLTTKIWDEKRGNLINEIEKIKK